jgi:hypothetical protein
MRGGQNNCKSLIHYQDRGKDNNNSVQHITFSNKDLFYQDLINAKMEQKKKNKKVYLYVQMVRTEVTRLQKSTHINPPKQMDSSINQI